MQLAAIWRYPIKSMRGEPLEVAQLTSDGVHGGRLVQVFDQRARLVAARSYPTLLPHQGTLCKDDEPMVGGHAWQTPEARASVVAAVGPDAELRRGDARRFDVR